MPCAPQVGITTLAPSLTISDGFGSPFILKTRHATVLHGGHAQGTLVCAGFFRYRSTNLRMAATYRLVAIEAATHLTWSTA